MPFVGVGPKMWELAGAKAAGVVTHPTNSDPMYLREPHVTLPGGA